MGCGVWGVGCRVWGAWCRVSHSRMSTLSKRSDRNISETVLALAVPGTCKFTPKLSNLDISNVYFYTYLFLLFSFIFPQKSRFNIQRMFPHESNIYSTGLISIFYIFPPRTQTMRPAPPRSLWGHLKCKSCLRTIRVSMLRILPRIF